MKEIPHSLRRGRKELAQVPRYRQAKVELRMGLMMLIGIYWIYEKKASPKQECTKAMIVIKSGRLGIKLCVITVPFTIDRW